MCRRWRRNRSRPRRIEPRFGIDEEPARRYNLVSGGQPFEHRVKIVLPRAQFDLNALEQPRLALDVDDLLHRIDHSFFGHDEELGLGFGCTVVGGARP